MERDREEEKDLEGVSRRKEGMDREDDLQVVV